MTNVTFGATFKVSPSVYNFGSPQVYKKSGIPKALEEELSTKLDKITPKKYSLVLTQRDEFAKEDTFALRRNDKNEIKTLSAIKLGMHSAKSLTVEKLHDIFEVLFLKAKHTRQEARLEQRLENLRRENSYELQEKMKSLNILKEL